MEERIFKKIAMALKYGDQSLYEALNHFDEERQGKIKVDDLKRVFKRLGLFSVDEHIPTLLKSGGVGPTDQVINIKKYQQLFKKDLDRRIQAKEQKSVC